LRLSRSSPIGLASPNLDNRPQILNGFAYRYPLKRAFARSFDYFRSLSFRLSLGDFYFYSWGIPFLWTSSNSWGRLDR
ncbi:hypothetical protein ACFGZW_10920, partial [Pasteurella multocida]